MRLWWAATLLMIGCAYRQPPADPFWAEVERHRPEAPLSAEYEAQLHCASARVVRIWQCDDATCRALYECPNWQR